MSFDPEVEPRPEAGGAAPKGEGDLHFVCLLGACYLLLARYLTIYIQLFRSLTMLVSLSNITSLSATPLPPTLPEPKRAHEE